MEKFGERLGIYQGGRQAPHTDIAAFFIQRTRELYLQDPKRNPAIWLVKKSSLRAGQWAAFRKLHRDTLAQSIDLEDLQPFGGGDATRCCLLLEHRPMAGGLRSKELKATRKADEGTKQPGKRPRRYEAPETALERIRFSAAAKQAPQKPSGYLTPTNKPVFRQGATVLPHVLTIAGNVRACGRAHPSPRNHPEVKQGTVEHREAAHDRDPEELADRTSHVEQHGRIRGGLDTGNHPSGRSGQPAGRTGDQ